MSTMPVDRSELIEVRYRRISRAGLAANLTLIVLGIAFLLPMLWMFFASVDSDPLSRNVVADTPTDVTGVTRSR